MQGEVSETMHKEQPSGEAWERLVEACREYRDLMKNDKWYLHPYIAKIVAAFEAYEAAQSAEPSDQQATIERLTRERDEALAELRSLSTISGQTIAELQEKVRNLKEESELQSDAIYERNSQIAILRARIAKPEMPEMPEKVRALLDRISIDFPAYDKARGLAKAVRDHYSQPFRIDKPGWYLASDGEEWRVAEIDGKTAWGRKGEKWHPFSTERLASSCFQLTKYLRPLKG